MAASPDEAGPNPWSARPGAVTGAAGRRRNRATWLVVSALGFLVFELTADPALAVALGCVKVGWDEFRTARRLRRDDPDPVRGRVCAHFYRAWGLWKISMMATALMFAITWATIPFLLQQKKANRGPSLPSGIVTAMLIAMTGFVLSAGASGHAVISALCNGIKVWVGVRTNRAKTVLLSAIITAVTTLWLALIIVLENWLPIQPRSPGLLLAIFVPLLGAPVAILIALEMLERRMIARSPAECWAEHLPSRTQDRV